MNRDLKAITPVISIIILLLITVALAGASWSFISGYWSGMTGKQIEVTDSFCVGGDRGKVFIKNIGSGDIRTADVRVIDKETGIDITSEAIWSTKAPRSGLVLEFKLEDGSGTNAVDTSGYGNDGALLPVGLEPTWGTGRKGGGLEFDGISGYVDAGTGSSLDMTNAITISAWAKNIGNNTNGWSAGNRYDDVVTKWDCTGSCSETSWWFGITSDGRVSWVVINSTGRYTSLGARGTTIIRDDSEWHHLAVTYDGSYVMIYVDGIVEFEKSYSEGVNVNSSIPIRIAASGHVLPGAFNGTIDEVRVYNRSLSNDEIEALMNDNEILISGEIMTMTRPCSDRCNYRIIYGGVSRSAIVQC